MEDPARASPATQVEKMAVASHKWRGADLCPVLTFVSLVSFCGQHYSFRCCSPVKSLLATKRHKIHQTNNGISRESIIAITAIQHPGTKRLVDFLLLREDFQAAICRGCSRAQTLFSPGFGPGEGIIGK